MTAVASPSSLQTSLARNGWPTGNDQISLNAMTPDEVSRMFVPRKSVQRSNSSSSLSSNSSTGTVTSTSSISNGIPNGDSTNIRKKPARGFWPSAKAEPVSGISTAKPQSISASAPGPSAASAISALHNPSHGLPQHPANVQNQAGGLVRPPQPDSVPMLCLSPMNGTFERKTIEVPYHPEVLKIGRQTNAKTLPTPVNGYFDSKVLSRQHAEIWAERDGKIWIRDVRSSNGTFVNSKRLSLENRDSEPHLLKEQDVLELGIDIVSEDGKTIVHHKVAARIEHSGIFGLGNNGLDIGVPHAAGDTTGLQWSGNWRQRQNSNGSIASARSVNSYASGVSGAPYGKWLQPVTMEQIVKKLNTELKQARLQATDLRNTSDFVDAFLNNEPPPLLQPPAKPASPSKSADAKLRLAAEPPAPPPSQPLPEKPDGSVAASRLIDMPVMQPLLRRSDTEKASIPMHPPNGVPTRADPNPQLSSLIEALSIAHEELAGQTKKMKIMEEALRSEREARSTAEQKAAGAAQPVEEAVSSTQPVSVPNHIPKDTIKQFEEADTTDNLQKRLDRMDLEMDSMRQQVEVYRRRAEAAEHESQRDRQTLAEMVVSIRKRDEAAKKRREIRISKRQNAKTEQQHKPQSDGTIEDEDDLDDILDDEMQRQLNGRVDAYVAQTGEKRLEIDKLAHARGTQAFADTIKNFSKAELDELGLAMQALRAPSHGSVAVRGATQAHLIQASPYASLVGVVLLGVGMMAYLNGWQRVGDR